MKVIPVSCERPLRVRFFGRIRKQILESKNGFCVFFITKIQKTDHESKEPTLRVDSLDQISIRIFEIHDLSVFFFRERIRKLNCCQAVFQANLLISPYILSILRDKTFDRGKENSGDYSVSYICKVLSKSTDRSINTSG